MGAPWSPGFGQPGIGPGSAVADGQRFAVWTSSAFRPQAFGPTVTAAPAAVATVPPVVGAGYMGPAGSAGATTIGGYGTADNNTYVASVAASQPFSFKSSPLPFALIGLVVSLVLLRAIFWRHEHIG